jgi:hypothetical protein
VLDKAGRSVCCFDWCHACGRWLLAVLLHLFIAIVLLGEQQTVWHNFSLEFIMIESVVLLPTTRMLYSL